MAVAEEMFPKGLRVLVVDDNNTCLTILERLLQSCQYIVTITNEAIICLQMLRENCDNYDIVISDVHMPHMDGFALLQHIGLELDIPVVMLSANDDPKVVMRGVKHGAVDYLLKPVRIFELKNIWQHVVRRNQQRRLKGKAVCTGEGCPVRAALTDGNANANPEETLTKKRKDQINSEDGVGEVEGGGDEQEQEEGRRNDNLDLVSQKKPRVVWSPSLHKQFVIAVNSLGADKAYPKKILDLMNVEGLTRENVASHLQKYRLYLKRMNGEPGGPSSGMLFGAQDSSIYLNGRPLLNPFGALCSLGSGGLGKSATGVGGMLGPFPSAAYHSGLSQPASNLGKSLLQDQSLGSSRLMDMSPLQNQNNSNRTSIDISSTGLQNNEVFGSQTSGMAAQQVVAPLSDYVRRMENWQSSAIANPTAQQNLLADNQLSSANFNNSYSSLDFSQLDLEGSYINVSGTLGGPDAILNGGGQGQDYLSVQTVGYNMAEPQNWQENMNAYTIIAGGYTNNPMVPAIGSSNPSFGEVISAEFNNNVDPIAGQVSGNTSGFMQFMEARDADGLDDNFLFEESELLAGFSYNDCGSLDDIIGELPK